VKGDFAHAVVFGSGLAQPAKTDALRAWCVRGGDSWDGL
jgi:hypothetical protein